MSSDDAAMSNGTLRQSWCLRRYGTAFLKHLVATDYVADESNGHEIGIHPVRERWYPGRGDVRAADLVRAGLM